MDSPIVEHAQRDGVSTPAGLRNYYIIRAGVAAAWVGAAVAFKASPAVAATLLIAYPAWDAIANLIDVSRNGGAAENRSQAFNVAVSGVTAVAVAAVIGNMHAVLGVFGAWAILAGLLQLATGVGRWKSVGAQWAMVLSGAQSALAGSFFIHRSFAGAVPGIGDVAGYAAFGALYFAISAIWLLLRRNARG